jgi:Flp pilus assembly protein TadD
VDLAPGLAAGRIAAARVARARGRLREASTALEAVLADSREDLDEAHAELAETLEQAGDRAGAERHFLAAVAARPGSWLLWNYLGGFRLRAGNLPGARAAFDQARRLAPAGRTLPAENLATLLFLEGRIGDALVAYEKIPGGVADPDSASNMGTLYFFNGRLAEAARSFRKAIQISPRQPIYHRNLADTLLRLGREDEARAEYQAALALVEELLKTNPSDPELGLERVLYQARAGRCDAAVAESLRLSARLPESAAVRHALARPFALCGKIDEALAQLRRAVALGFAPELLREEDELAALRGDAQFQRLTAAEPAAAAAKPSGQ